MIMLHTHRLRVGLTLLFAAAGFLTTACRETEAQDGDGAGEAGSRGPILHQIEGNVALIGTDDFGGVQVYIPGTSHVAFTDSEGNFRLSRIPPGDHVVMAQFPGYEQVQLGEVGVEQADTPEVYELPSATLEPKSPATATGEGFELEGRVYDAMLGADAPEANLGGAQVELVGTRMKTVTDPDGAFYLWNVPPGEYELEITRLGYEPLRRTVDLTTGTEALNMAMAPDLTAPAPAAAAAGLTRGPVPSGDRRVNGILEIYDAAGMPVTDYDDVAVLINEQPDRPVEVDPDGTFTIRNLAPQVYTLDAFGGAWELPEPEPVDLTTQQVAEVVLTLTEGGAAPADPDAPGAIEGTLVTPEPETVDLSGVQIGLTGTSLTALSDAAGRFLLEPVPPGEYALLARSEGYKPTRVDVRIAPGERLVLPDVVLEPDIDYPEVVATSPPNGEDDVIISDVMPMQVRFSKDMDPASVRAAVSFEPPVDFRAFAGKEHPRSDFKLLYIEVFGSSNETPMRFDQPYRLLISTAARDTEGLPLQEPFVLSFRTSEPAVMATLPVDGAEGALLDHTTPVIIKFNAPIDPNISARDIRVRPSLPMIPEILVHNDPRTGWSEIHIQSNWREDTEYEVTVGRGVQTATKQPFANTPYTFSFETAKLYKFEPLARPVY